MQRGRASLVVLGMALLSACPVQAFGDSDPPAMRRVAVRLAADETFRARPGWEATIRRAVSAVGDIYARKFQIWWEIADIVSWESGTGPIEAWQLLERLSQDVSAAGVDVVVGVSSRKCAGKWGGAAEPFGARAVILTECEDRRHGRIGLEKGLSHELAHLLGAYHVGGPEASVMNYGKADEFDRHTTSVILLMRNFDFGRGVAGLDEATKRSWLAIFAGAPATDGVNSLASALYKFGKGMIKENPTEAIARFREAIRIKPDFAEVHADIGAILGGQGKLAEALPWLRRAIELDPQLASAHSDLGAVLARQGKMEEAIPEYRIALSLAPEDANTRYRLGDALLRRGKLEDAVRELRESVRISPTSAPAYMALGVALGMQRRFDESTAAMREAVRIAPELPDAHSNLGFVLAQQGRLADAIIAYREALRLDPKSVRARINLGEAYLKQGNLEEAGREFQELLRLEPRAGVAYYYLATIAFRRGEYAVAWENTHKAAELGFKVPGEFLKALEGKAPDPRTQQR